MKQEKAIDSYRSAIIIADSFASDLFNPICRISSIII